MNRLRFPSSWKFPPNSEADLKLRLSHPSGMKNYKWIKRTEDRSGEKKKGKKYLITPKFDRNI